MDLLSAMRVFVRVVELRSFTLAADDQRVSRSAVSKQVAMLESPFKARLLHRTTRSLNVTDIGEAIYRQCKVVLAEVAGLKIWWLKCRNPCLVITRVSRRRLALLDEGRFSQNMFLMTTQRISSFSRQVAADLSVSKFIGDDSVSEPFAPEHLRSGGRPVWLAYQCLSAPALCSVRIC